MEIGSDLGGGRSIECSFNRRTPDIAFSSSSSFRLRSPSLNSVRLRRIFDVFDKNKDSLLSVEELSQALNLLGLEADPCDLDSTIRSYIKPGHADLTFEDFQDLHRSLNDIFFGGLDSEEENGRRRSSNNNANTNSSSVYIAARDREESDLSEAFKVFDEDGDGYISARELQVVLGKLGLAEEGRELDRVEMMISCVDTNRDGLVDFCEFKDMMRSIMAVPSASA